MALPVNIDNLIKKRNIESERLEFKKGWNPEDIIHSICAFANDINNWGGGYIIIGIEQQNGTPILPPLGLEDNQVDSIQKKITELCYLIQTNYTPVVEPIIYQEKCILVIWVPGGDNRPYKAPISLSTTNKKVKIYAEWVRKGSSTVKASLEDQRRLSELAAKVPFDDRINHNSSIEDFSLSEIQQYLKEVKSDLYEQSVELSLEQLVRKMNIAKGADENLKPINIGLLMFNDNPAKFFRGAEIQIITYEDEVGDNFTEKSFQGPLHKQLRTALQYLEDNIIKKKTRKITGKAEALRFNNYPFEAIEEALANAVYHKSYEHQSCIEVNIRLDKIEILSFPGPLPPLDNTMLKKPRIIARDYRNRRIGDFLKELRLTEGRGTGIPKIRSSMKINGSPAPVFETDRNNTYFLTVLPIHPEFTELILDEHKISILNYCRESKSRRKILVRLGLTNHYDNFKRHALPLIEAGYLDYTLPDIPNSRKQEYITSSKGMTKLGQVSSSSV